MLPAVTGRKPRQPPPFLVLGSKQQDRLAADAGVDVDESPTSKRTPARALHADGESESVEPGAPVLARDQDSHQAGFSSRPDRLLGEAVVSIYLGRERKDDALRELTHPARKFACSAVSSRSNWALTRIVTWSWKLVPGISKAPL